MCFCASKTCCFEFVLSSPQLLRLLWDTLWSTLKHFIWKLNHFRAPNSKNLSNLIAKLNQKNTRDISESVFQLRLRRSFFFNHNLAIEEPGALTWLKKIKSYLCFPQQFPNGILNFGSLGYVCDHVNRGILVGVYTMMFIETSLCNALMKD